MLAKWVAVGLRDDLGLICNGNRYGRYLFGPS